MWNIMSPERRKPIRLKKETDADGVRKISEILDDGGCINGDKVVVIDDLVTEAGSKLETIRVLRGEGLYVKDLVVIVDREQGGKDELKKLGYSLYSLMTLTELLNFGVQNGKMSEEQYQVIMTYLREEETRKKDGSS
jgi:uridine monophosphate synthetase